MLHETEFAGQSVVSISHSTQYLVTKVSGVNAETIIQKCQDSNLFEVKTQIKTYHKMLYPGDVNGIRK